MQLPLFLCYRKWYDPSTELRSVTNINLTNTSPSMHTKRRMIIRDKLFMQHITDMMSMGQVSDIIKESIEITHVKITQDFKCVNVFYISSSDTPIDHESLQKCAGIIRHELSQLRVIGMVPPIYFVENKLYFREKEVEKRLAMITFEEDSETSDVSSVDQILHKKPIVNDNSKMDEFYIQLPIMRHDVLGLDHHKIMSQITSVVSKAKKAAQIRMLDMDTSTEKSDPVSKEVKFLTREEQRKVFSDFLIKRKREARRMKQSDGRKLLNNLEEEMNNEESDYENDVDADEYIDYVDDEYINEYNDNFQDDTRK
ncbi:Putative ribosome-binding factor A, mitochondrial [Trachymyrmex septentrionalis]|uniref:Putative ribosome-binding factor A, mitochondrial n=1 Tax=Trachymyrmex septentrionalis TaxID=34720 RepID=A0A195F2B4_9HYME|nr:Putative ribosome-binding factor A, mitochondrial [Trachymyrmex septentrionalis]